MIDMSQVYPKKLFPNKTTLIFAKYMAKNWLITRTFVELEKAMKSYDSYSNKKDNLKKKNRRVGLNPI